MNFDWYDNGFAAAPTLRPAPPGLKLYRAWGGRPGRKRGNVDLPGSCFALDAASSRWHAEMLSALMEYQNPVRFLIEFTIPPDTPVWMGEVHPGDRRAVFGELSGRQAFVEQCHMFMVKGQSTVPLRNDLGPYWVHVGARASVDS